MITRLGLVPRKAGLSSEAFQEHWRTVHARVVIELEGLRRYWQNHAVLRGGETVLPWPGFDACAQIDFDDLASMDRTFSSDHYLGPVRDDERNLVDWSRGGMMLSERVLADGHVGPDTVRLMTFMRCALHRTPAELRDALQEVGRASSASGRELFMALDGRAAAQRASVFDACEIQLFDTVADAEGYVTSTEAREQREAYAGLVRGTERLIARAHVVI